MTDYPTRQTVPDADGWLRDKKTGAYVRLATETGAADVTASDRWLRLTPRQPIEEPDNQNPPSRRPPFKGAAFEGAGWYVEAHPTHYDWREDVEQLAWRMERDYYCYANTYYDHPPGWGLDATSVDFWHPDGRGVPIDEAEAEAIISDIFNDPNPPWIAWFIRNGQIWTPSEGYEPFGYWPDDGSDSGHYNHVHFTFQ